MSIRLRLTLWYSGLLAFAMVALGSGIYLFVNFNTYDGTRQELRSQFNRLEVNASFDFFNNFQLDLSGRIGYEGVYVQLVNYVTGEVKTSTVMDKEGNRVDFPYPKKNAPTKTGYAEYTLNGYHFLAYQVPYRIEESDRVVGLLQIFSNTTEEERFMKGLRTIMIFSTVMAIFIASTIGLFLARKALRPIEDVIRATNQIENGSNLAVRIPRGGPNDEMGRLTDTLNGMLERLETTYNELDEAYRAQRRFVSDASHELRTPLTTIRGNVDLLEKMWLTGTQPTALESGSLASETGGADGGGLVLDEKRAALSVEAMKDISEEAKRMSRLVADMLSLARADAGYVMDKEPVTLLPLVEEVARRAQHLPRKAEWIVGDLAPLEGVVVEGNSDYLRQLLFIFIENAFKYTPEGQVELRARVQDGQAGLMIRDTGIGLNSEEIPHIFERFYRADVSRGKTAGTGLGLSIAKWIIDEHRGSVEVETREGEGSTFLVWLPVFFPQPLDSVILEETDVRED